MTQVLCRRGDLDATGAKEVVLDHQGRRVSLLVARHGTGVVAYLNTCPHARMPLNWKSDRFFDLSNTHLFCSNHVAYFDVATGACFRGPAKGKSLTRVKVHCDGDAVVTELANLP